MKKTIKLTSIICLVVMYLSASAQIKVFSGGKVNVGATSTPAELLEVTSGNINLATATQAYMIGGSKILWNYGNTSDIFVGIAAGNNTMSGHYNTLMGYNAGNAITTGHDNVFVGYQAGHSHTTSYSNSIVGSNAFYTNTTGGDNSALGTYTLYSNTSGSGNSAVGVNALRNNTTATVNTAFGMNALLNTTTAGYNTAVGYGALMYTTAGYNTAQGYNAGTTNTSGYNNTFIGYGSNPNAYNYTNATAIGNGAFVYGSNRVQLGNNTSTNGVYAYGPYNNISDGRFKTNVTENVKGLAFINKLRPVTYKMDTKALDDFIIQNVPDSIKTIHQAGMDFASSMAKVHSGFIAQEVEQAAQQVGFTSSIISAPANSNEPYALAYSELVVPLVKAVQELSHNLDSLQTKITQFDSSNTAKGQRTMQNNNNDQNATNSNKQIESLKAENEKIKKELVSLRQRLDAIEKK